MAITNGDDVITNSDDDIAHASASEADDPHSHIEPVSTGRTPPMGPRPPLPVSVSEARRECYRRYSGLDVGVEDVATRAEGEEREDGGQERPQGMPTVDGKSGGDEVSDVSFHDCEKKYTNVFLPLISSRAFFPSRGWGYSWSKNVVGFLLI